MLKKYFKKSAKKKIDFDSEDLDQYSISELKKIADYSLRQFLISGGEYIVCPLTGDRCHVSDVQVAHYIDRACMNTRYDLDNCHLVSSRSNMWDAQVQVEGFKSKHHYDYEMYLGEKIVKELKIKSEKVVLFQKDDYIRMIEKFRNV